MYASFFGLNKKPFQITADPAFLWMGEKHRQALATLKYGVMDNKGFLLLTGDVGTGKTTLINRLVEDIQGKAYTAKIPDPGLSKYDFFRMVCRYFGLAIEIRTKSDFLEPFSRFLNDAHEEKKSVLLLIDEAQRLKHDLMEEIRLLSNLERQDTKLLNIFFVGQNEFNTILLQPENRALMRRITVTYNIDPLDQDETGEYIHHRLKVAGATDDIFSKAAVEAVYDFSNGFPRQINIICDLAMFFASQVNQRTISQKIVNQCRERISFPLEPLPAINRNPARPPVPEIQPRPFARARGIWLVMALLALGAGAYLVPGQVKANAWQWVSRTCQSWFHAFRDHSGAMAPTTNALEKTVNGGFEATTSKGGWTPSRDAVPAEPGLHMPRRSPNAGFSRPDAHRSNPAPTLENAGGNAPQSPDPGDAVDWLLEKRKQEAAPPDR